MANARKCNRCKKCFDPLDIGEQCSCRFENPVFQNADDLKNSVVGFRLVPGKGDIFIDLCPDCAEKFLDFMAFRKKEDSEHDIERLEDEIKELREEADFWASEVLRRELEMKELRHEKELIEATLEQDPEKSKKAIGAMKNALLDAMSDYPADKLKERLLAGLHEALFGVPMVGIKP